MFAVTVKPTNQQRALRECNLCHGWQY